MSSKIHVFLYFGPKLPFDLFLTYFNYLGVSGPLARPPFQNIIQGGKSFGGLEGAVGDWRPDLVKKTAEIAPLIFT